MALFDWFKRFAPDLDSLEEMSRRFEQMLEDGRHAFDLAATALLSGGDPDVVRKDLFETDARINHTEIAVRRMLLVHGAVHGRQHLPELLVMMSVLKDAERIGDYAKNIFDVAVRSTEFGPEGVREELIAHKDNISKILVRTRNLYHERDQEAARTLLADCDAIQDACDERVHTLLEVAGQNCVAGALSNRYFKRIASHAGNIATSLVMPVDKLDFFDEPRPTPSADSTG